MNSVSPSAAQYVGGVGQEEPLDMARSQAQPLEPGGSAPRNGEPDEVDKLKAKLMSAFNNVKYGGWIQRLYLACGPACARVCVRKDSSMARPTETERVKCFPKYT